MKRILFAFFVSCSLAFGQVALDVSIQQVNAGGTAFNEVLVPGQSAITTTLASWRSAFGLGTEDAVTFSAIGGTTGTFSALTSGRVPFVSTGGLLVDASTMTFSSGTLTLGTDIVSPLAHIGTDGGTAVQLTVNGSGEGLLLVGSATGAAANNSIVVNTAASTYNSGISLRRGSIEKTALTAAADGNTYFDFSGSIIGRESSGYATRWTMTTAGALSLGSTFSATQLTSTIATGTAPLVVASTTRVSNLNAATAGNADTVTTNANLTGDVTSVGNAATIAAGAVTLAKMADLAQDQVIIRTTASTGVPQTATITAAARTVLDDTTVGAMVDTLGGASASGSGGLVRITGASLVTPTLGVATATSLNKVAITAPATSATLTVADGKTLTASNTLTFTGTDSSSVAFGAGGTVQYTGVTKREELFNWSAVPDTGGEAIFEPYTILAANDIFGHTILRLGSSNVAEPTVRAGVYGKYRVPQDFVGNAKVIVIWTATLTTGNVVYDFDYRSVGGDDTTSLDQTTFVESVTGTDAAPTAPNRRLFLSITVTSANIAAGDTLEFYFSRDSANASDTMAGSAIVHSVLFEYTN